MGDTGIRAKREWEDKHILTIAKAFGFLFTGTSSSSSSAEPSAAAAAAAASSFSRITRCIARPAIFAMLYKFQKYLDLP